MPQYLICVPPGPIIYSVTCCLTLILEPNNPRTFALGVGFQTQSQTLSNHIIHQTSSTTKAIFSALLTDSESAESVCRAKVIVIALDLDSATANESESSQSLLTGKVYKYFTCQPCRLPVSQHPPQTLWAPTSLTLKQAAQAIGWMLKLMIRMLSEQLAPLTETLNTLFPFDF